MSCARDAMCAWEGGNSEAATDGGRRRAPRDKQSQRMLSLLSSLAGCPSRLPTQPDSPLRAPCQGENGGQERVGQGPD